MIQNCFIGDAGGGRFAKCLLCYGHGHFSYNCPQNGHGIDPKVFFFSFYYFDFKELSHWFLFFPGTFVNV